MYPLTSLFAMTDILNEYITTNFKLAMSNLCHCRTAYAGVLAPHQAPLWKQRVREIQQNAAEYARDLSDQTKY